MNVVKNTKNKLDQAGFSIFEIVLCIVVVCLIGAVGWLVWKQRDNVQEKQTNTTNVTTEQDAKTGEKTTDTSAYTTNYEKLSFTHPKTWQLSDNSTTNSNVSPGMDKITLSSPSGLLVTIEAGLSEGGFGPYAGDASQADFTAISTLGGTYYLSFGSDEGDGLVRGGYLGTSKTESSRLLPTSNISAKGSSQKPLMAIGVAYPRDSVGDSKRVTVTSLKSDPSYQEALKIIESLHY